MIDIVDATLDDFRSIGKWLCRMDRIEMAVTRDVGDVETLAHDANKSRVKKVAREPLFPLFAFGATPLPDMPEMALVWGFKTEEGRRAIRPVTKYIRERMIPELRAMGVRRAICLVHPTNVASQKWLAHLGFQSRATLKGFGTRKEEMVLFQRDELDAG